MSLFALVVGLVVRCRCLRLLLDLLGGAGVSAVGTTLLQSRGWNEDKARNATLGKHVQERIELRRSGTFGASICHRQISAAPLGLNKCISTINPGLAPWALQEYRPCRALSLMGLVCFYIGLSQIVIVNMLIYSLLIKWMFVSVCILANCVTSRLGGKIPYFMAVSTT